jgi:hypothetical protein
MSEYVRAWLHEHRRYLMTSRISTSLCRIIFQSTKVKDALLFMTILSTDLKALKQRGYNGASPNSFYRRHMADLFVIHHLVERVLPQQKVERQAAEKAERVNAGRERTEKANPEGAEKVRDETSASFSSSLPEMTLHVHRRRFRSRKRISCYPQPVQ